MGKCLCSQRCQLLARIHHASLSADLPQNYPKQWPFPWVQSQLLANIQTTLIDGEPLSQVFKSVHGLIEDTRTQIPNQICRMYLGRVIVGHLQSLLDVLRDVSPATYTSGCMRWSYSTRTVLKGSDGFDLDFT